MNPLNVQPLSPGDVLVIHSIKPLAPLKKDQLTRQLKIALRGHGIPFVFVEGEFNVGKANPSANAPNSHRP